MKPMTRRAFGAAIAAAAVALAGCASPATQSASPGGSEAPAAVKIGITQIVSHTSLDAAREGFKKALADNGYVAGQNVTYDEQNAQGDQGTATSIANKFASSNLNLILTIATPTAQATSQVITNVPILFTAVTDPVSAQLVKSMEAPGGNVSGTTDLNPVAKQVELIKKLKPDAKTVGIIYSSGEVNSEVQVKLARETAQKEGLTLVEKAVTNAGEVQAAAESLNVDAIYVPTDNNVVSALTSIIQVAEQKKIPVVAGEGDSVKNGAVATWGIDYEKLGYQTGLMAVKILKEGKNPGEMPVESQTDVKLVINSKAAGRMGVTIPEDLKTEGTDVG